MERQIRHNIDSNHIFRIEDLSRYIYILHTVFSQSASKSSHNTRNHLSVYYIYARIDVLQSRLSHQKIYRFSEIDYHTDKSEFSISIIYIYVTDDLPKSIITLTKGLDSQRLDSCIHSRYKPTVNGATTVLITHENSINSTVTTNGIIIYTCSTT